MKKWEYEVYTSYVRDAQIYAGTDMEEDDDANWRDFGGDVLLDVVTASTPEEAVSMVASKRGLRSGILYTMKRNVYAGENDNRVCVSACETEDEISAEIEFVCGEFVRVEKNRTTGKITVNGCADLCVYRILVMDRFCIGYAVSKDDAVKTAKTWMTGAGDVAKDIGYSIEKIVLGKPDEPFPPPGHTEDITKEVLEWQCSARRKETGWSGSGRNSAF